MKRVLAFVARLVSREEGQDLMEYGLLVVLIAIAAMAGIRSVSSVTNGVLWETIAKLTL